MIIQNSPEERSGILALQKMLEAGECSLSFEGEQIELPASVQQALTQAAHHLSRDHFIMVIGKSKDMSTKEVADLLDVSRPHVVKLLEEGKIPFIRIGTHRRVRLDEALAYREKLNEERHKHLDEITKLAQDLGMYDL